MSIQEYIEKRKSQEFIQPYPQPLLGGALGLTSYDLAVGLNVPHRNVTEKIRRGRITGLCDCSGFQFAVFAANPSKVGGRPGKAYVLDVNAAKAFIIKWDNETAWSYLRYLLACEKIVENVVPKMAEQIAQLQRENDLLKAPRHRQIAGRAMQTITTIKRTQGIFGMIEERVTERKYVDEMNADEIRLATLQHCTKVQEGLSRRIKEISHLEEKAPVKKIKEARRKKSLQLVQAKQ